jgi:hypothetical protein
VRNLWLDPSFLWDTYRPNGIERAEMEQNIIQIGLEKLLLDEENPRLPESVKRDQLSMIDYIAVSTAIEELMRAIGENGYFLGEPLIAVPHDDGIHFIVVEGNRRLTALKLLQDPANCSNPGTKMREIADRAEHKPTSAPLVLQNTRADVLPYLGFRHITGVTPWEPLAKARYIEQLFNNTNNSLPSKDRYEEVARAIGSRRDHMKRNLNALAVYKVMKDEDFYGIDKLDDQSIKFSVLSTALADDKIGNFIGIAVKDEKGDFQSQDPIVNPRVLNKNAIQELSKWLFEKDKKGKTRVGESRNLRLLSSVIDNPKAIAAFRANAPLKIAHQMTSDSTFDFVELLYTAEGKITEAASMVATVAYTDDGIDTARRIRENIKLIGDTLKTKKSDHNDDF